MQTFCDNMMIYCDKAVKIATLLPSTYREICIKQKSTVNTYIQSQSNQNHIDLKQILIKASTNNEVVAARW